MVTTYIVDRCCVVLNSRSPSCVAGASALTDGEIIRSMRYSRTRSKAGSLGMHALWMKRIFNKFTNLCPATGIHTYANNRLHVLVLLIIGFDLPMHIRWTKPFYARLSPSKLSFCVSSQSLTSPNTSPAHGVWLWSEKI